MRNENKLKIGTKITSGPKGLGKPVQISKPKEFESEKINLRNVFS